MNNYYAFKYNLSQEKWVELVRGGVISTDVSNKGQMLAAYFMLRKQGESKRTAILEVSDVFNISIQYVYRVVRSEDL
jgi:hypothetical protein